LQRTKEKSPVRAKPLLEPTGSLKRSVRKNEGLVNDPEGAPKRGGEDPFEVKETKKKKKKRKEVPSTRVPGAISAPTRNINT